MLTIHKYPLPIEDEPHIVMPKGAQILSAQVQRGAPVVWALVNPEEKRMSKHWFLVAGTGLPFPGDPEAARFVGTIQLEGGSLVFHVFDDGETYPAVPPSSNGEPK